MANTKQTLKLLAAAMLAGVLAFPVGAQAQDLAGTTIRFSANGNSFSVGVYTGGRILITNPQSNCIGPGGSKVGGEAVIGSSLERSFNCTRSGKQFSYVLRSRASYQSGVLRIEQTWMENGMAPSGTQIMEITLAGNGCSGINGFESTVADRNNRTPIFNCRVTRSKARS